MAMPNGSQNFSDTMKTQIAIAARTPASQATAAQRCRMPPSSRPATNGVGASASFSRSPLLSTGRVEAGAEAPDAGVAGGWCGSGKCSRNSLTTSSGSRPMALAYARMNDRRKMPEGHRETSPRSSDWKRDELIFVLAEIEERGICLRSRSLFRRAHQAICGMLSSDIIGTRLRVQVQFRYFAPRATGSYVSSRYRWKVGIAR